MLGRWKKKEAEGSYEDREWSVEGSGEVISKLEIIIINKNNNRGTYFSKAPIFQKNSLVTNKMVKLWRKREDRRGGKRSEGRQGGREAL